MKRCGRWCGAPLAGLAATLCLAMAAGATWAEPAYSAPAVAQERAGIAEHRRLMLKILADEEAACRERFAVTACLDDVQRRRRDALAPLRERELRLDEAERRARADERRRAVAARLAAAGSAPSAPTAGPPVSSSVPASGAARPRAGIASSGATAASRPAPVLRVRRAAGATSAAAARDAEAAERVRDAERRREQTEVVRERIERRQAEREAAGRRGDPLPLPRPGAASQPPR